MRTRRVVPKWIWIALVGFLVSCAGGQGQPAAQMPVLTDKAAALQHLGPPFQVQQIEGDDFWYYVIPHQSDSQSAANILQGFSAGYQGRPFTPAPTVQYRTLILHFDGQTGVLKNQHWR